MNVSAKGDVRSFYGHTQSDNVVSNSVGGLVGHLDSFNRIENSRFSGHVRGTSEVGGLVGDMQGDNSILSSFALGSISGRGPTGGLVGLIWDDNVEINASFYSGYIDGDYEVGGLVGQYLARKNSQGEYDILIKNSYSVSYPYSNGYRLSSFRSLIGLDSTPIDVTKDSHWSLDHIYNPSILNVENNTTSYGLNLAALKCVTNENRTQILDCILSRNNGNKFPVNPALYQSWSEDNWDFGSTEELPGLKINDSIYRDSDADGILDTDDEFPFDSDNDGYDNNIDAFPANAMASIDTDNDGKPDNFLIESCYLLADSNLPINCHLILDKDDDNDGVVDTLDAFPLLNAASIDRDLDGYPDSWNIDCNVTCKKNSGLIIDAYLDDLDNDGIKTELDQDDNNDGTNDIDIDSDGLIEISTIAQLNSIRYQLDGAGYKVSSTGELDQSGCPVILYEESYQRRCSGYELTQDLDFNDADEYLDGTLGWLPIGGESSQSFRGIFEGNGKTLNNLIINRPDESYIGLFGKLYQATVRNVNLTSVIITGGSSVGAVSGYGEHSEIYSTSAQGAVNGRWSVGGLLGQAKRSVSINLSYTKGEVNGTSSNIGGLVGLLDFDSEVISTYSLSRVNGTTYSVGGLIGRVNYENQILKSFSSGEVIGSGGLIGSIGKSNVVKDVFSSGEIFLLSNTHFVGGLVSSVSSSNSISRALSVRQVKGGRESGGLIGYLNDTENQVTNSYWSIDKSMQVSSSGENTGQYYHGLDLKSLQCPVQANSNRAHLDCLTDRDYSRSDLSSNYIFYKNWGTNNENEASVWDFGNNKELPGLVINNIIYRDSDGDGILDSNDARKFDSDNDGVDNELDDFKFDASADTDADRDGKPDYWLENCNETCQENSELIIDSDDDNDGVEDHVDIFPTEFAASIDDDKDGIPDKWHPNCDLKCQNDSNLTLDIWLNDSDNDGSINTLDKFPQNANASIDNDNDGFPDYWHITCDLTCQNNSNLRLDVYLNDTDNDSVENDIDHFINDSAASLDTDDDGRPDDWHVDCDHICQANSELQVDEDDDNDGVVDTVDVFPLTFAASLDLDRDGFPDYWHAHCNIACQNESGLTLDASLFDTDNDGIENDFDDFINNPAASIDTDGDGQPDQWNTHCNLDCQMASKLILDEDDDNDGVRDENDAFSTDSSEFLDTDGDGIGNNADQDDDNDGVLDKNDSDIAHDNGLPVLIQVPGDLKLQVTSEDGAYASLSWTREQYSQFRAYDVVDSYEVTYEAKLNGSIVDISNDSVIKLPSGHLELLWRAKDKAGNYSDSLSQIIDVYPLVKFSQIESTSGDESQAEIEVELTGEPPEYPVIIEFKVNRDESDRKINQEDFSEEFDIESVHEIFINRLCNSNCINLKGNYQIPISKNITDEVNEQVNLELIAVYGTSESTTLFTIDNVQKEHLLTIAYGNLAPEVNLVLERNGAVLTSSITEKEIISVKAIVNDRNDSDKHEFEWDLGGITDYTIQQDTVHINTHNLSSGDYPISVRVSDLVEDSLSDTAKTVLTIDFAEKDDSLIGSMNGLWLLVFALLLVGNRSARRLC